MTYSCSHHDSLGACARLAAATCNPWEKLTQSQGTSNGTPIGDATGSHDANVPIPKLLLQHGPHFRHEAHDARSPTELVPTSIDALCHEDICAVEHRLPGRRDVADLDKHDGGGRVVQAPERGDDGAVRLDVAVGRKQPDRGGPVLRQEGQRRLGEVADGPVARDEADPDPERAVRRLVGAEQGAGLLEIAVEDLDVRRAGREVGRRG